MRQKDRQKTIDNPQRANVLDVHICLKIHNAHANLAT